MFIAALFTAVKLWNQPRCLTTNGWIEKIWCVYTVENYFTTQKNEIRSFAGKWGELEIITSSKTR
jgi:hypothetical protein